MRYMLITVSGADRTGIVQAVTEAIAAQNGSVVDLSTSTIPRDEDHYYMMALEITIDDIPRLKQRLQQVAAQLDVDIEVIGMEEELI